MKLKTVLLELEGSETKADVLLSIAELYRNNDTDKSLDYAQQAFDLSLETGYSRGQASALNKMGAIQRRKSNYEAAIDLANYDQASVYIFRSLKLSEGI